MDLAVFPFPDETSKSPHDPDSVWTDHRQTIGVVIIYSILICAAIICLACKWTTSSTILDGLGAFYISIILAPFGLFGVVLFSLMIETNLSSFPLQYQRLLQVINILFFVFSSLFPFIGGGWRFYSYVAEAAANGPSPDSSRGIFISILMNGSFLIIGVGFYFLCAIIHRIRGWKSLNSCQASWH